MYKKDLENGGKNCGNCRFFCRQTKKPRQRMALIAGDFLQFVKSACKSAEISHTSQLAGPGRRCTARIGAESTRSVLAMASDLSIADLVGIVAVFVLILAVYLTGGE